MSGVTGQAGGRFESTLCFSALGLSLFPGEALSATQIGPNVEDAGRRQGWVHSFRVRCWPPIPVHVARPMQSPGRAPAGPALLQILVSPLGFGVPQRQQHWLGNVPWAEVRFCVEGGLPHVYERQ